jgi:nucleoid DNA-binding protein
MRISKKPKLVRKRIGKDNLLCSAIVKRGFTQTVAAKLVNIVFDEIKAALERHEVVELPIGTFRVVEETHRPQRHWLLGQPTAIFTRRFRVVFEPSGEKADVC